MPKLTPFEAPMVGYDIQDRGATASAHAAATAREAGTQISGLLHKEGQSLEEGMRMLGRGLSDFNKDLDAKPAADKHDELLTAVETNNQATSMHLSLLQSFNQAKMQGIDKDDPKWLEKWTQETFAKQVGDFQNSATSDKDGQARLGYVKTWQSHFLFTAGPAAELDRSTNSLKTSYEKTKATALTSIKGGGSLEADGSEATMLSALKLSDTALSNVLAPGFNGDYKKLSEAHQNEQHDLVLASAEERIKSAKSPEEVEAALKEVMDPNRFWNVAKNRYGLSGAADQKKVEEFANHKVAELNKKQTADYTRQEHAAKLEYNTVTNDMLSKAWNHTLTDGDDKLEDVLKKHGSFIKADEVAAFRKNISYIMNHPGENTIMDMNVYQGMLEKAQKGQLTSSEMAQAVVEHKITEENMKSLHGIQSMVSKDEYGSQQVNAMMRTADIVHGHADIETGVIKDKEDALRMLTFRTQFYGAMQRAKEEGKWDSRRDLDINNPEGLAAKMLKDTQRTAAERAANPLGMINQKVQVTIPKPLSHIDGKFLIQNSKTGDIYNMLDEKIYDRNGIVKPSADTGPRVPQSR